MCRLRTCAAAAAWIFVMLALSACSGISSLVELGGQPAAPAFPPAPPQAVPETAAPNAGAPSPDQARNEIWRWFMKAGYKDYQAQALMEHAQTESGFRACANGGPYHYLFQWSGTRLEELQQFAGYPGCPQLHTQLAFADKELKTEPKFACFWSATDEDGAYNALRRGFGRGAC